MVKSNSGNRIWKTQKYENLGMIGRCTLRDDLWKYSIIRGKRGVFKVNGMVFQCREDANKFKNNFDHFGGQNHHFLAKMVILRHKLNQKWFIGDFYLQNDKKYVWNYLHLHKAENPVSSLADTPYAPDYWISLKSHSSLHIAISRQLTPQKEVKFH